MLSIDYEQLFSSTVQPFVTKKLLHVFSSQCTYIHVVINLTPPLGLDTIWMN